MKEKIELQKGFILQLEEKKDKDIELKKKQLRVILDQQDSCREKISDANTMISEINEKIVALNNPEKRKNDLVDLARKGFQRKITKITGDKRFYEDSELSYL